MLSCRKPESPSGRCTYKAKCCEVVNLANKQVLGEKARETKSDQKFVSKIYRKQR